MVRHAIPTAGYSVFTDADAAAAHILATNTPLVIKADGLAAGKGVVLPRTPAEGAAVARAMLDGGAGLGAAASRIVVEDRLRGPEVSVLAFCDGTTVAVMPPAQDHKRIYEFDEGPNTGGMGAFAPSPLCPPALLEEVVRTIIQPAVKGMREEGHPFVGVLYAGVMLDPERGPRALEFNCRFGDPETQVLLPLLEGDLLSVLLACVRGTLHSHAVHARPGVAAVAVVVAAEGYPGTPSHGDAITFSGSLGAAAGGSTAVDEDGGLLVFQAGTALGVDASSGKAVLSTSGGRVLAVTALGSCIGGAARRAYAALDGVHFRGMAARRDIGGIWARPGALRGAPLRVGVLGSTRGTAFGALLEASKSGRLPGVRFELVLSNRTDAGILERARAAGVPALALPSAGRSREVWEMEAIRALDAAAVDVVVLIGFMRVLTPVFTGRYAWRLLNVHPSLLPAFAGGMDLEVHTAVLASGASRTGCTVHLVTADVDGGPVLVQRAVDVAAGETPESLKAKVQAVEGPALEAAIMSYADAAPLNLLHALRASGGDWERTSAMLPASLRAPHPAVAHAVAVAPAAASGGRLTYAAAGVDIDAGDQLVENIKPLARSTARPGADAELGGFGGLFDLKAAGFKDPLIVSGTDGVGTKLRVAQLTGIHDTVGIDLVAMSVNDIIVQGAAPLVFLDYYASGHLDVAQATTVVAGIAEGCRQAGCALVGGETAEMPSMYAPGDYDLAGFAFGAVERDRVLPNMPSEQPGDVVIGIASSGIHSNGFSLVRKIVERYGFSWTAPPPYSSPEPTLARDIMRPTKIYIKPLLPLVNAEAGSLVRAMAHITGGGLPDNIPRVMRDDLQVVIDTTSWVMPPVFRWMQSTGAGVDPKEMMRTFNCE